MSKVMKEFDEWCKTYSINYDKIDERVYSDEQTRLLFIAFCGGYNFGVKDK